jgi:hypothetical protein
MYVEEVRIYKYQRSLNELSIFLSFVEWGETESTWYINWPLIGLLYQLRMIDDECGAAGGMRIDRGNRSTGRKPAPVPLCITRIIHDLTWDRTPVTAVGSRRLTA